MVDSHGTLVANALGLWFLWELKELGPFSKSRFSLLCCTKIALQCFKILGGKVESKRNIVNISHYVCSSDIQGLGSVLFHYVDFWHLTQ